MSYDGVGLKTARGSGTSGYVAKNLASIGDKLEYKKSKKSKNRLKQKKGLNSQQKSMLKSDLESDILMHEKRKNIERQCMRLRDELEDQDINEAEIEAQIKQLRENLNKEIGTETSGFLNVDTEEQNHHADKTGNTEKSIVKGINVSPQQEEDPQKQTQKDPQQEGNPQSIYQYKPLQER